MLDPLDPKHLVPNLIAQRSLDAPEKVFLVDTGTDGLDGGSVSYRQFDTLVERWRAALVARAVSAGDCVAVMLPTGITEHATWIACGRTRALQVPINTAYRGQMLAHVLRDCGARIAVATPEFAARVDEVRDVTDIVEILIVDGEPTEPHHTSVTDLPGAVLDPAPPVSADEIAAVVYTSGTTGPSKGVLVPWGQLATAISAFDDLGPGDTLYAPFAAYHLGGKLPLQLMSYWSGTFVFRDGFRTQRFWPDVRANDCNRAWLFHAMAKFVYQQPPRADDADNPVESISGGPLLAEHREFERRFGVRMRTNYGSTEIGWPIATGDDVTDHLSCGLARDGYDLKLIDEHGRAVGPDQVGELLVRPHLRSTMNAGYLNRPQATAEAWRDGWFHTGDAFRVDSTGRWYFVDRVKDAIRRRGENVSTFEVEAMIAAHPDVAEVAVIGVPSDDGEEEIKACVVRTSSSSITEQVLLDEVAPDMPAFMVPRYVEFVPELPKTPTSKVRKVELKRNPLNDSTYDRAKVATT
jgi:crotonobetaine/carnitine-CoA ligase